MKTLYIGFGAMLNVAWFVLLGWDGLWIPLLAGLGFGALAYYDSRIFFDPTLLLVSWTCQALLSGLLLGVPALPLVVAVGLSTIHYGVLYPRYRALVLGF